MKKFINRIAYIVPTKDRPNDLKNLLNSLTKQTYIPDQLIIVDGGNDSTEPIIKEYPSLFIQYIKVHPPSLTKQRNAGIEVLKEDIPLVGYLDDDLVLERDATEKMLTFWDSASFDVAGASFNISNNKPCRLNWFMRIFGINSKRQGVILKSGFNIGLYPVFKDVQVEWVCGGATIWRKEITFEYKYDEKIGGFGYYDDVDYSLRVGRKYKLYIVANAKVGHFPPPKDYFFNYKYQKYNTISRYMVVRKNPGLSVFHYWWSALGLVLLETISGIRRLNKGQLLSALGMMTGIICVLANRNKFIAEDKL